MAWGLPKLPGLTFPDPTKTQYHMRSSLRYYQGHRFPDTLVKAPGGTPTDVDSNAFALPEDSINYDPSLTYGRVKQPALPAVIPHFVHYDKKCLNFSAFMKQPVFESPDEAYRLRIVNIIYFLEDDSITVMEPNIRNSGLWQGRMVKRCKVPKNDQGECWHWKDLNVGKDICLYGKVFHTVSCDLFTKEWLESQGIEIGKEEDMPSDAHAEKERWKSQPPRPPMSAVKVDRLRRFLEYDGKVLGFYVVWDNREGDECTGLTPYKMLYFLQDDTIAIKELHEPNDGKDPFPLLLKKTKIPKKWKEKPVSFPSAVMETTDAEVTEYYSPRDLLVGETVFIFGRRLLIYDCDNFTRKYFKVMLNVDQPPPIKIAERKKQEFKKTLPPHIGIGSPEDTLQSCFGLLPKPPHKDVIRYNLNASKNLRYLCELEWIHPEDRGREFVLSYSLADGTIKISEIPKRNSGITGRKFLKSMRLQTPDSDPNFPTYITPEKFYIGAIVPVFKHRFRIVGCDLYVYRYMTANPEKFPPEVIDNVRNYHMREGNLKDDLEEAVREESAAVTRAQLAQIGQSAVAAPDAMEQCLAALNVAEGSASPPRPATPPQTTDTIEYDDSLRVARQSKPTCDNVLPLKGILKSGSAREDHQKVVCFSGPAPEAPPREKRAASRAQYNDDSDFCEAYRDPDAARRAEIRAKELCPYEVVQSSGARATDEPDIPRPSGHLGKYGVDCTQVAEHQHLSSDAYDKVKSLRRDTPEISPAAVRVSTHPPVAAPPVDTCLTPAPPAGPCDRPAAEDVAFACPHVEARLPCCQKDDRDPNTVTKL